jgi:hypothetical protein
MEVFHWLANLPVRRYRRPPLLGGTWYKEHHDILAHREVMTLILSIEAFCTSSSERTLREANL